MGTRATTVSGSANPTLDYSAKREVTSLEHFQTTGIAHFWWQTIKPRGHPSDTSEHLEGNTFGF